MKVDEVGTAEAPGSCHAGPRASGISCPDCGVPAEITERFSLPSTHGPVDHIVLRCAGGHHFRMPTDMLPAAQQERLAVPTAHAAPGAQASRTAGTAQARGG